MLPWDDYSRYRISPPIHSDLRHADIVRQLSLFLAAHPQALEITPLGESVEGRSISMLTLGDGPKSVLAWSQMHGNEPTHTAALLDLLNFLLEASEHPTPKAILSGCKLHCILMLNPDGAHRWTRRNAQDIDINRDALHLQSPEGLILRDTIKSLQPDFALNLHNHRPHTTAGQSQLPASFSLLAPPIDAAETETKNVRLAKQLAGYLAETVAPHCPGPVSRYDADFMPRCFGEWIQQQGAATVTIEAGGWTTVDAEPLVQLHFYGLVNGLEAIATGSFLEVAPAVYEALPRTGEHDLFDKLLRDVTVINGAGQGGGKAGGLSRRSRHQLPSNVAQAARRHSRRPWRPACNHWKKTHTHSQPHLPARKNRLAPKPLATKHTRTKRRHQTPSRWRHHHPGTSRSNLGRRPRPTPIAARQFFVPRQRRLLGQTHDVVTRHSRPASPSNLARNPGSPRRRLARRSRKILGVVKHSRSSRKRTAHPQQFFNNTRRMRSTHSTLRKTSRFRKPWHDLLRRNR